jgi:HK97 family phage major capsid protein
MLPRVAQSFLDRRVYLVDLLNRIPVSTGSVEYVQDITPLADLPDKAAETTEGSAKPQAGVTLQLNVEPIATVPAWVNLTRQAAADVPMIQGYLDTRLRYALKRRLDLQVIAGDGNLPNIKGLQNRSGILTYAPGGAEARAISIRHAIRLMEDKEAVPEIIVLNPADAELFDLTNSTSAGLHAVMDNDATGTGAFAGPPARTAWGLTQVHSTAIASGTALLLDPTAVSLLDRMQPTAYMTDSHASNFTANILTLLLELRAGLALFAPPGVLKLTFNGTT